MVIGDDPAPGEGNSTVKYIYYNQLAPAPSSTSLLNQLPASEPVSRTNSHGRRDQDVPGNSGLVTYRIRNSAGDQTRSVSFENVLGPGEGVSSEGGMSDKPGYLQLSVSRDLDSSTDLLNSSIARLSDLADYQIFSQLSRDQIPRVVSYRPSCIDTESGKMMYQEVAVTPSRGDIVDTINRLPQSSIIDSLDLDHRYLLQSSPRNSQLYQDLDIRPQSANRAYQLDPLTDRPLTGLFRRSLARLRAVKIFKRSQDDQLDSNKIFTKRHRRIISTISVISHTEKRAKTLGFKILKRDLKPFGLEKNFSTHQVDMHHFTYYAPSKNIFLRYCPPSLQVQFIAMRSFTRTKPSPQTGLLYGSRAALQRKLDGMSPDVTGGCILTDVSFKAKSGELSVILGGSGSGKTTLLDAIAHRLDGRGHPSGKVLIDGLRANTSTVKQKLAYVIQHDRLLPNLTVVETLLFVAKLAYPKHDTLELSTKVSEVLDELGLMHVKNSKVGDGLVRGISGGERRRLSIACQLIKFTHILLLDEPTTGLDSFNAYNLIETLCRLSRRNVVVIATIHQPRSELFQFFDMITLMSVGNVVYHGKRQDLIPYFTGLGYPCPDYRNPLDHYIDVVSVDRYTKEKQEGTEEKLRELIQSYRRSQLYTSLMAELGPKQSENVSWIDEFSSGELVYKLGLLVHRMNVNVVRSYRACGMRSTVGLMFALMLLSFILRLKDDQAGMQNRIGLLFQIVNGPTYFGIMNAVDLFPTLRDLFYRESMDGLYHPALFILAYFIHVFPFTLFTSLLFGSVSYWGIGFHPDFMRSIYFTAVFFILMLQGESIAVMILGLISDPVLANGVISLIMSMSITVGSGFIRNFQTLHPIFELLSYGSMHRYASSTLAANEFGGLNFSCSEEVHCAYETGDAYLSQAYPNALELKGENFVILGSYCLLLLVVCHVLYSIIRIPRLR
ncbi:hypothetical protein ACHWQZ_G003001 [Mnemiopsis leidyi]